MFICEQINVCFQDREKWNTGWCLKILLYVSFHICWYSFTAFLVHSTWVNMIDYICFSELCIFTSSLTKEWKKNKRTEKEKKKKRGEKRLSELCKNYYIYYISKRSKRPSISVCPMDSNYYNVLSKYCAKILCKYC